MASKSRMSKLKDLKMPKKPMADEEVEMDLAMLELDGVEEEEMPEDTEMDMAAEDEMDMAEEEGGMLDDISDEDLMAELQKRGLMDEGDVEEEEEDELTEEDMA